jgi:hypothetical protein
VKAFDYLIVNLMITDLFMIIPNFPMAAYNSFHGKWMFQQHGKCRIIKTY